MSVGNVRYDDRCWSSNYEKYRGYLLTIATALLNDVNTAEDVVHEFFLAFAQSGDTLKLDDSLKWHLVTCVSNRARDHLRAGRRQAISLGHTVSACSQAQGPESYAISNEEMQQVVKALEQIPYEQREAIVLHARGQIRSGVAIAFLNAPRADVTSSINSPVSEEMPNHKPP